MPALFSVTPSVAIDALDVVVIAPRGTNCTATLSAGQQVPIDVDPATLVDGCDSAAGLSSGSMFAGPFNAVEWPAPVYIAGAAVRSIRSTPNGLGCSLQFGASPGFLTVPNVTRAAMVDLLNATASPGGGGGGGAAGGQWVPTITAQPGNTCAVLSGGTWIRSGSPDEPQSGDVVIATVVLFAVVQPGSPLDALVQLTGIPECELGSDAPDLLVTVQSGDVGFYAYAIRDSASAFQVTSPSNATLETELVLSLTISYRVAGS